MARQLLWIFEMAPDYQALAALAFGLRTPQVVLLNAPEEAERVWSLAKNLEPAVREMGIAVWHPGKIDPGDDIQAAILEKIDRADIIGVFVSPQLQTEEWGWAVRAARERAPDQARVIPIRVRPVLESGWPFRGFQSIPPPPAVIASLPPAEQEAVWARIGDEIVRLSNRLTDARLIDIAGRLRDVPLRIDAVFERLASAFQRSDLPPGAWLELTRAVHDGEETGSIRGREAVRALVLAFLTEMQASPWKSCARSAGAANVQVSSYGLRCHSCGRLRVPGRHCRRRKKKPGPGEPRPPAEEPP